MKKRFFAVCAVAAALLTATGCVTSTVERMDPVPDQTSGSGRRVIANLKAVNNGVFLFYYIPIWTGAPGSPNRRDWDLFENKLRDKHMHRMLNNYAAKLKADGVEDVQLSESSTGMLGLWIFWRRTRTATAVAVEKR